MVSIVTQTETVASITKADFTALITRSLPNLVAANAEPHAPDAFVTDSRVLQFGWPVSAAALDAAIRPLIPGLPAIGGYLFSVVSGDPTNVAVVRWRS